ncbi:MAG: D-glycero-beta-D-manno-heptose 1-phosphate adenylyltransferase [Deltaproteobacteria bacterium]|nr:D-glycero-beta-D-manno-heptose 1-phosphate adenylyltransferase [Deltaproteobacteria bacterium]MBI3293330.1 D-glycero-beta-D-manno-heptose 1-phosphate adenylyltransferase [Deltaproteobacteria bacterium]
MVPLDKVWDLSVRLRSGGKRIVSTNGCFDILHLGHIQYLNEARRLGDVLVVGLNSDSSVKTLKGPKRPIHDERTRTLQIAALEAVDYVVVFPETTPESLLEKLRPFLHVKGGDYDPAQLPERAVVEKFGGKVRCLPLVEGHSTTSLLEALARPS